MTEKEAADLRSEALQGVKQGNQPSQTEMAMRDSDQLPHPEMIFS
jgi:hypothetical protein